MFLINFICEKKRIFIDPLNENKNLFNKKKNSIEYSFFGFKDPELEKVNHFSFMYRTCCNSNHCRDTY